MNKDKLNLIAERIKICNSCKLHKERTNTVPGGGDPDSKIMFIGEGPGFYEDQKGVPFVGAAGRLLDKAIEEVLLMKRSDIFVTNVVKCRPPNNRDPELDEIEACKEYLMTQISIIKPKIIATLGRFSMAFMLGSEDYKISEVHGQVIYQKKSDLYVFPLYHPAAALRRNDFREAFFNDFKTLKALIDEKLSSE